MRRLRYLAGRARGLARHLRALHRGSIERGHGPLFRRTVARLLTGSVTRFEHEVHHWAATLEGMDHPVMASVETETRGLQKLLPQAPALETSVVVCLARRDESMISGLLDSVRRQSRSPSRVIAACAAGEGDEWRDRLPSWVQLIETGAGPGGWATVQAAIDTPFALLVDGDAWLRPDLLYRYGLIQRLCDDPQATLLASAIVPTNRSGEVLGSPRIDTAFRPTFPVLLATEWVESGVWVPVAAWRSLGAEADPAAGVLQIVLELVGAGLEPELVPVALRGRPPADAHSPLRSAARAVAVQRLLRARGPSGLIVGPDLRLEPLASVASSLTVIVPYRDRAEMTLSAIRAVLQQDYPAEISVVAVDNGSQNRDLASVLERLGTRVLRIDEPFNFSRLNNLAARGHDSDLVLFLNNDVWLEQGALRALAEWAQVPAVGAVGAVLSYPDGRLQHAGIERDSHGPADEQRWSLPERGMDPPQLVRALRPRIVDAVTGACLMLRRDLFERVGGFDEVAFPNAFSDTDLCQRIIETRRVCVVTPSARGIHDESASRRYDRLENFEGSAWFEERLKSVRHRRSLQTGEVVTSRHGRVLFGLDDLGPIGPVIVDVLVSSASVDRKAARRWLAATGVLPIRVVGVDDHGEAEWRLGSHIQDEQPAQWFVPAGDLAMKRGLLELLGLVAVSEGVDAVVCAPINEQWTAVALERRFSVGGVFSRGSYAPLGARKVRVLRERRIVRLAEAFKALPNGSSAAAAWPFSRRAAVRYVTSFDWPDDPLPIAARRVWYGLEEGRAERPTVIVLLPFLARGGAEHTLLETLLALRDRFRFIVVTLVPHRDVLGDSRADFERVADLVLALGEMLEGDGLSSALEGLVAFTGAEVVYNANGSDTFYRFALHLKARRPNVRVIDHLYDNVHGYISYYREGKPDCVDVCIAENQLIRQELVERRGWRPEQVRVVWPCGRRPESLPSGGEAAMIRERMRAELGFQQDDVVFLTAARLHPQKRPHDLLELAVRVADEPRARFLWVGGGQLEGEFERALARRSAGRIERLPFRDDVPRLILASDVGCLVSDHEGLPVFMLECLQLGRPFLCTDVGDVSRVLEPSGAGIVSGRPGDLAALDSAVRKLCDPCHRQRLANKTKEAAKPFTPHLVSAAYAEVLGERGVMPARSTPPARSRDAGV